MQDDILKELRRIFAGYEKEQQDPVTIGLLGQPGAGKSSLINSLTGQELAGVGVQTDYTTGPKAFQWKGLSLCDLPGYGTVSFPEKGYLERFKVLNFDALLCIASGKFREEDTHFFQEVMRKGKTVIFVRTHLDALKQRGRSREDLKVDVRADLGKQLGTDAFSLFFVDNDSGEGVTELAEAILEVLPAARRAQFRRWAAGKSDTFLQAKRNDCNDLIGWFAAGSAANALNPVPGAGVAVDLGLVVKMQQDILAAFGFTEEILRGYMSKYQFLTTYIGPLLNSLTREGAMLLLGRFVGKEAAKWVPILGPIISAAAGAGLVWYAGQDIADRCHDLARKVRDAEMRSAAA